MSERETRHFFANQINEGPGGIKSGDRIEYRGSFTEDGETEYGRWNAGEVGPIVDWGFIVTGRGVAVGIARKWEDEGKTWRRAMTGDERDQLAREHAELLAALEAVTRESDRKTVAYDRAHALIAKVRSRIDGRAITGERGKEDDHGRG